MNKPLLGLAALAVTGSLGLAAVASADPTFMGRAEFDQVSAGQTKTKVENVICNCTGQKSVWQDTLNGNLYTYWWYASRVGSTYIGYRVNSSGVRVVGDLKYWCESPYGDGGIPEGGCSHYPT